MCNSCLPVCTEVKKEIRNIDKIERSMDRLLINSEKRELIINHPATYWNSYFQNNKKRLAYQMCWKVINFWVYTDSKDLYTKVDNTYYCDDRLCPICIERHMQSKRAKIMEVVKNSDTIKDKYLYLMVLTLKHNKGSNLYDLIDKTFKCKDNTRQLKNNARKWKNKSIFWSIEWAYRAVEVTKWENGWHPHINYLLVCDRELDLVELKNPTTWEGLWTTTCEQIKEEWMEMTWDSYVASVSKLTHWSSDELLKSICEVVKYTMKDDCLNVQDKIDFLNAVKGKRLTWCWWSLYNVKLDSEDASDVDIDDIDLVSDIVSTTDSKDTKTKKEIGEMQKVADAPYVLWLVWWKVWYRLRKIIYKIEWIRSWINIDDWLRDAYYRIDVWR